MDKRRKRRATHIHQQQRGDAVTVKAHDYIYFAASMPAFSMHIHKLSFVFLCDIGSGTNEQLPAIASSASSAVLLCPVLLPGV